jgi:hypothetical protein
MLTVWMFHVVTKNDAWAFHVVIKNENVLSIGVVFSTPTLVRNKRTTIYLSSCLSYCFV